MKQKATLIHQTHSEQSTVSSDVSPNWPSNDQQTKGPKNASGKLTADVLESFEKRLRSLSLTPSQQALASVVLDNPERVAMSTIHVLAADLGINESTISRFALALELKGYSELRSVCRALASNHSGMLWRFMHGDSALSAGTPDQDSNAARMSQREVLAAQDSSAITTSFARIDEQLWDNVVSLLSSAEHVSVMGLRQSQSVASMLVYLLGLVRSEVKDLTVGGASHIDALRDLASSDCVVAIATRPCSKDTVRVAEWSRKHGVPVIAITDEVLGPLTEFADYTLLASTDSEAVLSSMTALVSIVQALTNDVAVADIDSTRQHLEQQEDLLNFFDVYAKKNM
ncbi:MAG: MurR/RpiR family transcriptional regulator [Bifidobacterium sp.]|jgi:DNA-binding MurR/RpiR family transcriptional regulator|nr:MurR/RpiR family transcriptional regulator [Bifidobacterium sp.]MCH4175388.1 MurR/RpiR family transcriptional regulator [Bifidobacterium sp.]